MNSEFSNEILSLRRRRALVRAGVFDKEDADEVWPGARGLVASFLAGGGNVVAAALSTAGEPVAWAAFESSRPSRAAWLYGNLVTRAGFRRRGLARSILLTGLNAVRTRGARRVYCFVDTSNEPSRLLHERLGFRATGLVKSVFADGVAELAAATPTAVEPLGETALVAGIERGVRAGLPDPDPLDACYLLHYLLPQKPLLFWKTPTARVEGVTVGDDQLYVRRSNGASVACLVHAERAARESGAGAALGALLGAGCSLYHADGLVDAAAVPLKAQFHVYAVNCADLP